jgi:trans-2,3-dihydro-3-hydroxyanthranilate isomerase
MSFNFYIVDVFAQEKYAGNQLAVFTNAATLSTEQMQRFAKEMNYSETTFILSNQERSGGYDVRIFTPQEELPFAGHPTLGTAYILQMLIGQSIDTVRLNLKVGQIPVSLHYQNQQLEELWMQQKTPQFGQQLAIETISPILNLEPDDFDSRFPIQAVSTGVPFFIVPLKTHAALKRAKTNLDKCLELVKTTEPKAFCLFCPETYDVANQLSVRMFADAMGIAEDPATGSANGCLAGYLSHYAYFGSDRVDVRVEQGHEIGRPSLLLLKASRAGETIEVFVGGKVILVAKGEFV